METENLLLENLLLGGVPRRGEVGRPSADKEINEPKWDAPLAFQCEHRKQRGKGVFLPIEL
jgi:hypothetical protein